MSDNVAYPIVEVFKSIQGEGINTGLPATFIRMAGCDLHCIWCDQKESWDSSNSLLWDVSTILDNVSDNIELVVITGGEPTIHNLDPLFMKLKSCGYKIAVETNGVNVLNHNYVDWITCSPKREANFKINEDCDELKYIVDDQFTLADIKTEKHIPIFLNPESCRPEMTKKAFDLVVNNTDRHLRLGVQLHQLIGVR